METPFNTAVYQNIHTSVCDNLGLERRLRSSVLITFLRPSSVLSLHLTRAPDNDGVGLLSHSLQQLPVSSSLGTSH